MTKQLSVNQGFLSHQVEAHSGDPNRWRNDTERHLRKAGLEGIKKRRISWCDFDWLFKDTPKNRKILTENGVRYNQEGA
jgi:hypothetical protein